MGAELLRQQPASSFRPYCTVQRMAIVSSECFFRHFLPTNILLFNAILIPQRHSICWIELMLQWGREDDQLL